MELKAKAYRLIPLSRLILAKLYVLHVNDDPRDRYNARDIAALFSIPISVNLIKSALERMHRESRYSDRLIIKRGNKGNDQGYAIGDHGITVVERALLKRDTDIAHYIENGDSVIDEIAGMDARFLTDDERVDIDDWAPLDINRDTPEYLDAIGAIEETLEGIRQDNGFAANYPSEREGIMNSLSEGLEWLKQKRPSKAQIKAMILVPLRWIVGTFGNAVLGVMAKNAAQKIVDFLLSLY
jgi:hypothetical protein